MNSFAAKLAPIVVAGFASAFLFACGGSPGSESTATATPTATVGGEATATPTQAAPSPSATTPASPATNTPGVTETATQTGTPEATATVPVATPTTVVSQPIPTNTSAPQPTAALTGTPTPEPPTPTPAPSHPMTATVGLNALRFSPSRVQIAAGGSVTFVWNEGLHNVVSTGPAFNDHPDVVEGASFTATFAAPGTYTFVCQVHLPTMTGSVIVH